MNIGNSNTKVFPILKVRLMLSIYSTFFETTLARLLKKPAAMKSPNISHDANIKRRSEDDLINQRDGAGRFAKENFLDILIGIATIPTEAKIPLKLVAKETNLWLEQPNKKHSYQSRYPIETQFMRFEDVFK